MSQTLPPPPEPHPLSDLADAMVRIAVSLESIVAAYQSQAWAGEAEPWLLAPPASHLVTDDEDTAGPGVVALRFAFGGLEVLTERGRVIGVSDRHSLRLGGP